MSMQDPIANFITSINNASRARHLAVSVPHSKLKEELARLLKEQGYIQDFEARGESAKKTLSLRLKYTEDGVPVIAEFKQQSKPSCRKYVGVSELPVIYSGFGEAILSTSKGLMTAKEAKRQNLGGEIICSIF